MLDSSVMARMQKKFWKTKQVLIKATGKKEDEYVVASDADLDAKLEFFRSVQSTCTELLKVIQRYQHRISSLSQEENELGLFLRFQGEHDHTRAGNMMDATSQALCTSAKKRLALCPPLHRLQQEVETFRRRAIADTLLTVERMERARTEYRGALLWMKDASQELDPDTYKQLEKFRKVQSQVRGTKGQFDKLKNDVCQKVDMLGASRCNMLSHSLCTYQTTLLQFWEKTAHTMSGIHQDFQGHVSYQFTTLKALRDPLEQLTETEEKEEEKKNERKENKRTPQDIDDDLVSLDDIMPLDSVSDYGLCDLSETLSSPALDDDLILSACDLSPKHPYYQANHCSQNHGHSHPPFQPREQAPPQAEDPATPWEFGDFHSSVPPPPAGGDLLAGGPSPPLSSSLPGQQEEEEEEAARQRGDMDFLKDLLSPGPGGGADEFSREWQDAFGLFDAPNPSHAPNMSTGGSATPGSVGGGAPSLAGHAQGPQSQGFLPSQLLDHSLGSAGWSTPPMFQAPPLQAPPLSGPEKTPPPAPSSTPSCTLTPSGGSKNMSAWFNLFADLDPLSNPDAIGRSEDELLNA
ncbi:Islet cell autoantigen 1-like protein [Merluccius polli]|uniref:Islet cell autoantigen 1-like protein n=1 Tax=Merluccius polli TaxID=89951 RepID=A0AA47P2N9_MERPO|nr:Islet cell autoantigen 1-like protein [Merluccius polli]